MRNALIALSVLSIATPAFAATPSKTTRDAEAMAERLNDPVMQAAVAGGLQGMLGAVLDMRIDGVAKALEPLNRGRPLPMKGRTLRELAERDDPYFDEKLKDGSRAAVGSAAAMASAFAAAMPELERAMARMAEIGNRARDRMPEEY